MTNVVDVIRKARVDQLALFDGCLCGSFSIRNVDVSIYCGKGGSSRRITVRSASLEYFGEKSVLRSIAEEVRDQLQVPDMPIYTGSEHL